MAHAPEPPFAHDRLPRVGVLLVNLGTPDEPTSSAVRRYLAQFLSDPRVIEIPPWLWKPILYGVILVLHHDARLLNSPDALARAQRAFERLISSYLAGSSGGPGAAASAASGPLRIKELHGRSDGNGLAQPVPEPVRARSSRN